MKNLLFAMTLTIAVSFSAPKPTRVVLIGVDGMGSAGIGAALKAGRSPNVRRLIDRGRWSPAGRGIIPTADG